jgi:hypothetical protein
MAVAALFPTPAEVEASTPATRDRAIDVIRIVSLVGVVVGHTIMATSTLRDGVFIWSNLLTASPVFQALTWVFQIPPLLAMHLAFDYLGYPRFDPTTPGFIVLSVVQLLIMGALVTLVFVTLRPLENSPLPLWDGGLVAKPGRRSMAVGALLCIAGAATLASVGWGLKDQGLYLVAVILVALATARGLADDSQRVCAASRPARIT